MFTVSLLWISLQRTLKEAICFFSGELCYLYRIEWCLSVQNSAVWYLYFVQWSNVIIHSNRAVFLYSGDRKAMISLQRSCAIFAEEVCYLKSGPTVCYLYREVVLSLHRSCAIFTKEVCYLYRGAVLSLQRSYVIFTEELCYLYRGVMLSLQRSRAIFTEELCYLYSGPMLSSQWTYVCYFNTWRFSHVFLLVSFRILRRIGRQGRSFQVCPPLGVGVG